MLNLPRLNKMDEGITFKVLWAGTSGRCRQPRTSFRPRVPDLAGV